MRQSRNDENILSDNNLINDVIAEARALRKLSMSNARQSLVKFLKEEKLPLDNLANAELDLDTFVDLIIKRSRERDDEEDKLNPQELPYLNTLSSKCLCSSFMILALKMANGVTN